MYIFGHNYQNLSQNRVNFTFFGKYKAEGEQEFTQQLDKCPCCIKHIEATHEKLLYLSFESKRILHYVETRCGNGMLNSSITARWEDTALSWELSIPNENRQ